VGGCETGSKASCEDGRRDPVPGSRREGEIPGYGGLLDDLNPEGIDAAQMDGLVGVTNEILAAQMEILAENEVSDSREDTVDGDSEKEASSKGKGTHNPVAPELKTGSRIVYLGQGEMRCAWVMW
jgi:hypothetical protein